MGLIDRQAAIEAVRKAKDKSEAHRLLVQIPSAQRWIPVAKGLPGKYEYVLLTCERNGKLVTDFGCLSPDIDGDPSWWIAVHDLTEGWRVIAWMPLPSPWKGERR